MKEEPFFSRRTLLGKSRLSLTVALIGGVWKRIIFSRALKKPEDSPSLLL